jgi:zinc/manganese transport system substrate-binding protein
MCGAPAAAQEKVNVVATFSILADLVKNVGGDRVSVASLVGPHEDAHAYAPSPADARRLAEARLVVANGLGFEGWMTRLVRASGTRAPVVVASQGIEPLKMEEHGHTEIDPHAWQSVANAKIYAANIRDALIAADPTGKRLYEAYAQVYLARLDALEVEVKVAIAAIPPDRRKIVTTHDAFAYFSAAYGIEFVAPQGVSSESEASARDVARIIRQIKRQRIPAVFMESISDDRLIKRIASETGARIGGAIYSDALSDENGPAPTYIDMMRNNIRQFSKALTN